MGSPVETIYLYSLKGFDKKSHKRLLLKQKAHDIGNGTIDWIETLLIDRTKQ